MKAFEVLTLGGFAMIPLAACSVILIAVVVWRCISNAHASTDAFAFLRNIEVEATRHGWDVALAVCRSSDKPVARVCAQGIIHRERPAGDIGAIVGEVARREVRALEWGLTSVGTIATIAPFIGLLGTVFGVIRAFSHIGAEGKTGAAVVASGVAEALVSTAAGLIVGVIAVIAYNALTGWHDHFAEELDVAAADAAQLLQAMPNPGPAARGVP